MNFQKLVMVGILLLVQTTVAAEVSSKLTLASDNVSRGISETDGAPAILGSIDYTLENGVYAGLWASNVRYRENAFVPAAETVEEASIEIDYYLGYYGELSESLAWEAGAAYATYPGAEPSLNYDFIEFHGKLYYGLDEAPAEPEFSLALFYSPDESENAGPATYMAAGVVFSLPMDVSLSLSAGKQSFSDTPADDYSDWKVGLSTEMSGLVFEIAYTDTNLSKLDCGGDMCDARFVFSVASEM